MCPSCVNFLPVRPRASGWSSLNISLLFCKIALRTRENLSTETSHVSFARGGKITKLEIAQTSDFREIRPQISAPLKSS